MGKLLNIWCGAKIIANIDRLISNEIMTDDIIPDDVKQFILQNIDSIAQMEGLLIFQSNAQKTWSAEAISHELYTTVSEAEKIISLLLDQGFIRVAEPNKTIFYRYHPKSDELKEISERITGAYKQYLVPVTNLIHSKPKNKIQQFADAFKIRRD